jgi:hypothetical protein
MNDKNRGTTPAREGLPELPAEVFVAITRGEGYEDVCDQILAEDAFGPNNPFEWRVVDAAALNQPAQVGGGIWPAIDKMLVAAYEHGLNDEPMDMMAMQRRFAALPHPQPVTGGRECGASPTGKHEEDCDDSGHSKSPGWCAWCAEQFTPPPPSDAAQGDAKGEMFGTMDCADFEADTITFTMEPGYYAAAGRYRIVPAAHKGEGNG